MRVSSWYLRFLGIGTATAHVHLTPLMLLFSCNLGGPKFQLWVWPGSCSRSCELLFYLQYYLLFWPWPLWALDSNLSPKPESPTPDSKLPDYNDLTGRTNISHNTWNTQNFKLRSQGYNAYQSVSNLEEVSSQHSFF